MIDIIATICLEQMKKLPKHLEFRRHIQERYNNELHPSVETPEWSDTVQYYCARVPKEKGMVSSKAPDGSGVSYHNQGRDTLIDYLSDKNIHTSVHFKPLHKYEILKKDEIHKK